MVYSRIKLGLMDTLTKGMLRKGSMWKASKKVQGIGEERMGHNRITKYERAGRESEVGMMGWVMNDGWKTERHVKG